MTGGTPAQTASQPFQLVINNALTITTVQTLPGAVLSVTYTDSLVASGGLPPYTWTNPGGEIPPGLTLSSSGLLSGTPTVAGNYSFTLQVSDSFSPVQKVSETFVITVASTTLITTTSLPNGTVGTVYSQTVLTAAGGKTPYLSDGAVRGALPHWVDSFNWWNNQRQNANWCRIVPCDFWRQRQFQSGTHKLQGVDDHHRSYKSADDHHALPYPTRCRTWLIVSSFKRPITVMARSPGR